MPKHSIYVSFILRRPRPSLFQVNFLTKTPFKVFQDTLEKRKEATVPNGFVFTIYLQL